MDQSLMVLDFWLATACRLTQTYTCMYVCIDTQYVDNYYTYIMCTWIQYK